MSHQCIADAFAPAEADYKEKVMQHTWGHLAPQKGKSYRGSMLFTQGDFGDLIAIRFDFPDLDSSPWLYQDMQDFICEHAKKAGTIYRFKGCYRNHAFKGSVTKLQI